MFTRIRVATGLALMAILITSVTAFAKGGFSFITITGPDSKGEIRSEDLALTEDFFSFANFYQNKISTPADPGAGYEITRHYVQGVSDVIFDRLHYYPETGFVFYDGIENGESEYDGEWYAARPGIKTVFEKALSGRAMDRLQSGASISQTQPDTSLPPFYLIVLAFLTITAIGLFTFRLQKSLTH